MTDDKLVEAHGSVNSATCLKCKSKFKYDYIKGTPIIFSEISCCDVKLILFTEKIFKDDIPTCTCGGIIKPDIVFFGELLPPRFHKLIEQVRKIQIRVTRTLLTTILYDRTFLNAIY